MFEKRATTQCLEPAVELLVPGARVKTAGAMPAVQSVLDALAPDPTFTYALVNAMGYSEFYGPNSNSDWYGYNEHLDFNGLLHAWPDIGTDVELDRIKGKRWGYGYPCFYNAAVFAHHKNSCPIKLGFGDVQYVWANHDMKRSELLLRVHNDEARRKGQFSILERLAGGERSDVSMGARVPFDTCAICTDWKLFRTAMATFDATRHAHEGIAVLEYHKKVKPIRGLAITSAQYCQCMRTQKRQILSDGRKVFVYNDWPRFFDISFVFIGADRTARAMWYLAPAMSRHAVPGPRAVPHLDQLLQGLGLKVAAMTKEITGVVEAVVADAASSPEIGFKHLPGTAREILGSAAALGIVASPREFQDLWARDLPLQQRKDLGGAVFSTEAPGCDTTWAPGPQNVVATLVQALRLLAPERSGFAAHLAPRLLRPTQKVAAAPQKGQRDPLRDKIAAAYSGYRLGIMKCGAALAATGGAAVDPLAPDPSSLLLGAASLLHLVASHIESAAQTLEPMTTVLPDASFGVLATLGHGIESCMLARNCSLPAAIAALVSEAT